MEIISKAQREADLADQVVGRAHEQCGYDTNIANYEAMLEALPQDDWPEAIAQYRGLPEHEGAFACPADMVDELARYQLRDRVANLIKSERIERAKVSAILKVIDAQLTGAGREAALQAAVARRAASFGQ